MPGREDVAKKRVATYGLNPKCFIMGQSGRIIPEKLRRLISYDLGTEGHPAVG